MILLMGPTGAGKTRLALEMAREIPVEIVSVDSAMVYRGMDIGTAKPTLAERAAVPHHLIDILDPAQRYSVGQFVRDARVAVEEVQARSRIPLLVGGTMLYFHALLHGLAQLPEGDPQLRAAIDEQASREGWPALHARLARLDPQAAAKIHPNDPQRIQRALEVCLGTGKSLSALQGGRQAVLRDWPVIPLVADIPDRGVLHERIVERFELMLQAGFIEEVAALRARPDLTAELPALRAVGYRQIWQHLDGKCSQEQAVQQAVAATRQLAKRQLTWLRGLERSLSGDERQLRRFDAGDPEATVRAAHFAMAQAVEFATARAPQL